ncbi:hypothetical protein [Actinoplanes solisilvae]|uniref:hypothetical protein n=1 Tax=Actinoplanes solisilvae TaxID=2486853 RepID=UPI000FD7E21F|nr:hypothetical protein [Actinoplanes solisilvae]
MSRIWIVIAVIALSGCDGAAPQEAAPAPASSPAAPSAAVDDPPGALTCAALATAIAQSSLMVAGVVDDVVRSSATADAPVADAAERLGVAYAKAVSAAGTEQEPDAVAAVGAAASDMSSVCSDSGLKTVG